MARQDANTGTERPSVTLTAMVGVGMLIALGGLVMVIAGLGGSTSFEADLGGFTVSTGSTGLAVIVLGLGFAGFVMARIPAGASLLSERETTPLERLQQAARPVLLAALVVLALLVISLLWS